MKQKSFKSGQKLDRRPIRRRSLRAQINEHSERAGNHFTEHFVRRLSNVHQVRLWVLEWVLLVLLVFLLALVQIIWYNQAHESIAFKSGGTYSEASIGKVNSLNPLYATTDSERVLAKLLFANIVSPDASGHQKGDLARSIHMEAEGRSWTVQLRDDLKWSDGQPITADDLIFTVNLMSDKSAKTVIAVDFSSTKLEKIDNYTVKFNLPSPYVDFEDSLEFPLLPEHVLRNVKPALMFENEFSAKPVGSGPFAFNAMKNGEAVEKFSQVIYLNRNEEYHKPRTKLDRFILKVYTNKDDIVADLKSGSINGTGALSVSYGDKFSGTSISRRSSALNGGAFAFINGATIQSKDVRQAIRRGVDMNYVRSGLDESRVLDYPILENQEKDVEFPAIPAYDLQAARVQLAKAGLNYDEKTKKLKDADGNNIQLQLAARHKDVISGVAERFAEELRKLGFEAVLRLVDDGAEIGKDFFASVVYPRDYDILIYEVDLGVSADPFVYYSSTQLGALNLSNYENTLADDALLSARMATSGKLRTAKYNAFLRYWVDDVPAIALYRSSLDYYYINDANIYAEDIQMTDKFDRFQDVNEWAVLRRNVEMTP